MSSLVRRVKSTIYAGQIPPTNDQAHVPSHKQTHILTKKRESHIDLSSAVESEYSLHIRNQLQQRDRPISDFRRRLARKASTFSLRGKRRSGLTELAQAAPSAAQSRVQQTQEAQAHSHKKIEDCTTVNENKKQDQQQQQHHEQQFGPGPAVNNYQAASHPPQPNFPKQTQLALGPVAEKSRDNCGSWFKMASETVSPPMPYTRLKEIATSVSKPHELLVALL